jgi:hypothetical protein
VRPRTTSGAPKQLRRESHHAKAHLYESIFLANRGIDDAIQGLERLKRANDSGLIAECLDKTDVPFQLHRASLNVYFYSHLERLEERDVIRFETRHDEYQTRALHEVQVYRDLRGVQERRRAEGKPCKVRFMTEQEQQEWQRQYPKLPDELLGGGPSQTGLAQP